MLAGVKAPARQQCCHALVLVVRDMMLTRSRGRVGQRPLIENSLAAVCCFADMMQAGRALTGFVARGAAGQVAQLPSLHRSPGKYCGLPIHWGAVLAWLGNPSFTQ